MHKLYIILVVSIASLAFASPVSDDEDHDYMGGAMSSGDYNDYSGSGSDETIDAESDYDDEKPNNNIKKPIITNTEDDDKTSDESDFMTPSVVGESETDYEDENLENVEIYDTNDAYEDTNPDSYEDTITEVMPEERPREIDIISIQGAGVTKKEEGGIFSWINDFWGEKYFLAALLAGAIIGFIIISLVILFICYTVRKSDEGSYIIDKNLTHKYGTSQRSSFSAAQHQSAAHILGNAGGATIGTTQEYKYQAGAAPEYFA